MVVIVGVFPAKGVQNEWCAKRLEAELVMVPWQRSTLKSEQESAILTLETAVS